MDWRGILVSRNSENVDKKRGLFNVAYCDPGWLFVKRDSIWLKFRIDE